MEEMVLASIERGMKYLGISSHASIEYEEDWTMEQGRMEQYLKEISSLKEKYKKKIDVFVGLEIDYLKGIGLNPIAIPYIPDLDYYIGSVHSLARKQDNSYCFVDESRENLSKCIDDLYNGDIKEAVGDYYNSIKNMITNYRPDILGHIDIIKKNNADNYFFNEQDQWYKEIVEEVLLSIKASKTIVEVNTGGIIRYGNHALYPSAYILERIYKMGIPITVNGDSHNIDQINYYYEEVQQMLKHIGFKQIMILTNKGWELFSFN